MIDEIDSKPIDGSLEKSARYPGQSTIVYAWEYFEFADERNIGTLTLSECRSFVQFIWADMFFRDPAPIVCDGRGHGDARLYDGKIHLPKWSRNKIIILHELAHYITDLFDEPDSRNHAGKFMKVYLLLMAKYRGNKYTELVRSARNFGLVVSRANIRKRLRPFKLSNG